MGQTRILACASRRTVGAATAVSVAALLVSLGTPIHAPVAVRALHHNEALPAEDTGVQRCGLGASFHAGRRAALLEALRAQSESGIVLVRGLPATREYVRFTQDKTFWYLTGVESPGAALVMDVKSGQQTLFLPPRSLNKERWEGEIWDAQDDWVKDLTGFADVRASKDLLPALKALTAETKLVWISKEPWITLSGCHDRADVYDLALEKDKLDGRPSRESALEEALKEKLGVEVKDCASILAEMRRVKRPEEIDAMRRAGRAGAAAMVEAIRSSRAGLFEYEIEALMSFVQRREGASGPAYYGIIGSGPNALILHYSGDTRELQAGEMLLVDYAPEFDHYTSDITRSWPVDGQFTPRMAELYDAVLEAQAAGIAAVKPGKKIDDVEAACTKVLAQHGMMKLMRHGSCHYIGMEVHDVGESHKLLEPGVAFTVEPGVYETATGIGVRIEDVVVVTETGCEVLSAGAPKDRKTIVALVAEEGILDRLGNVPAVVRPPDVIKKPGDH